MRLLSSIICELVFGHQRGPWVPFVVPGLHGRGGPGTGIAHFERSQCRWCRRGYVRRRVLPPSRLEQEQAR